MMLAITLTQNNSIGLHKIFTFKKETQFKAMTPHDATHFNTNLTWKIL